MLQIPPTPTPLPPGIQRIAIPDSYSLWQSTDAAIHAWRWVGAGQIVIQALILIVIVLAGLYIFNRFVNTFTLTRTEAE
jgi:ABC-type multidrug transport system permease subunit